MVKNLEISPLTFSDREQAYKIFEEVIPFAYEREGLGFMQKEIESEILHKKQMADASLKENPSDILFFLAKIDGAAAGTISFGKCGEDILKCTDDSFLTVGELGSLFVLPQYHDLGVASALIKALIVHLHNKGIPHFCLDSGYKHAQKRWLRKFGTPHTVAKDYWAPGFDHYIWLCRVEDFIASGD